ncbi:MAG: RNA polymerase sigma-54 factor, partial [Bacteroidales bacterium]|nr:RNA polymerase sigma-54 factor [Bacteroidales bacterium]
MAQSQIQEQKLTQGQKLAQTISHQQLLQATLVELPITQLVDRINTEMNDNPALEADSGYDALDAPEYPDYSDDPELPDDFSASTEREERQS